MNLETKLYKIMITMLEIKTLLRLGFHEESVQILTNNISTNEEKLFEQIAFAPPFEIYR